MYLTDSNELSEDSLRRMGSTVDDSLFVEGREVKEPKESLKACSDLWGEVSWD